MDTSYRAPGIARAEVPVAIDYPARDAAALVGRVLIALLFVWSGIGKLTGFSGTAGYIGSMGLPLPSVLAGIAVLFELGFGLLLLIGWRTRWMALLLALFIIVVTPIFHAWWSAPQAQAMMQQINFGKNCAILGGLLMVYAFGPGRFSVDRA